MIVDKKPFYSCIIFVKVVLVWQLLIFPLSGKCWIVVQTNNCSQNPNYQYKLQTFFVKPKVKKNNETICNPRIVEEQKLESCDVDIGYIAAEMLRSFDISLLMSLLLANKQEKVALERKITFFSSFDCVCGSIDTAVTKNSH